MSPPPSKDWWLAAALTSAAIPALAQQPATANPDAVVTTVTRPGTAQAGVRHLQVSADAARGQRLRTDGQTAIHVLFADQSAITVAPNSEVVVQQYSYDDKARNGSIVVELTQGVLRMVGGFITKRSPARVITKTATVGIRGGITVVQSQGDTTDAAFLFGDEMTMQQLDNQQSVFRPGFGLSAGLGGLSEPNRDIFDQVVNTLLVQLNTGSPGQDGGSGNLIIGVNPGAQLPFFPPVQLPGQELIDLIGEPGPGNQS